MTFQHLQQNLNFSTPYRKLYAFENSDCFYMYKTKNDPHLVEVSSTLILIIFRYFYILFELHIKTKQSDIRLKQRFYFRSQVLPQLRTE